MRCRHLLRPFRIKSIRIKLSVPLLRSIRWSIGHDSSCRVRRAGPGGCRRHLAAGQSKARRIESGQSAARSPHIVLSRGRCEFEQTTSKPGCSKIWLINSVRSEGGLEVRRTNNHGGNNNAEPQWSWPHQFQTAALLVHGASPWERGIQSFQHLCPTIGENTGTCYSGSGNLCRDLLNT